MDLAAADKEATDRFVLRELAITPEVIFCSARKIAIVDVDALVELDCWLKWLSIHPVNTKSELGW